MSTNVLDAVASPSGVFECQDELRDAGHEQIVFCHDGESGLRAIIAIHDTTLDPGLGGTRFHPDAGGLIQVGSELSDTPPERVRKCVRHIGAPTEELLRNALTQEVTTLEAARLIVAERLSVGRSAARA